MEVLADVIKFRWGQTEGGWALSPMTGVPVKTQRAEGHVKMEEKVEDAATSQGLPRIVGCPQKLGRDRKQTLPRSLQEKPTLLTP